jgi:methyltransferase
MVKRYWLLGAFAAERLFELWLSRRNAMRLRARGAVEAGRRHTRVMVWFHAAVLASVAVEGHRNRWVPPRWFFKSALAALACAQAIRYWAVLTLGERWNIKVLVPPASSPVVSGPYGFLRHPNYLAVILEMAALPLAAGALWTAIVASLGNAVLLAIRIPIEESALGASYQVAFADRPRLLSGWNPHA